MSEQHNNAASANVADTSTGAVSLTIDYSNGAQKSFSGVPWRPGMGVLDVLKAAGSISPGLVFEYTVTLPSDRAGRQWGFVASIDGAKVEWTKGDGDADSTKPSWLLWINADFVGRSLHTEGMDGGPDPQAVQPVNAGDVIALKLATGL